MSRKPISKKVRFDVFKRDGFRCAYCGNSPPACVLEIDHVIPVSAGGENTLNNLLTSCFDCNRGESNRSLSTIPPTLSRQIDVLKEKEDQITEYEKYLKRARRKRDKQISLVEDIFREKFPKERFMEGFKQRTLPVYLEYLTVQDLTDAMRVAVENVRNPNIPGMCVNYFKKICQQKIYLSGQGHGKGRQE